ncbi:MAG TPA: protein kinase [Vicinamibacterales bacterium]|nr:protein kinase [Vicinamibacterales bacterium]
MNTVFHRLGPYEVIHEIGRGGMALVVLATDTRTGRNVALKLVPIAISGEARDILEAEQLGGELQRQFSQISTHVPLVYEHLPNESGYFIVAMEYLDGENLSDLISRGAVPIDRAVTIAVELCVFLDAAHNFAAVIDGHPRRSVVHGDLKPQNVRITSSGAVKVLDFGIAKALSLSRKVTRNDFGTRPYLSPERLDDDGEVNEFADLWAVGVMLYEMIRGARPFEAPDTQRLERIIRSRQPAPPLTGDCPDGLAAIVARLLGPTPDVRYESARAIREDLDRFTAGQRTAAEAQGWPARARDVEATRRTTRSDEPAADEATRRTRPVVPPPLPTSALRPPAMRPPVAQAQASLQPSKAAPPARSRTRRLLFRAVLVILGIMIFNAFANEFSVMSDANRVAGEVSTRELDELGELWKTRAQLDARSSLQFGTAGLEHALIERTLTLADGIIGNYRMGLPNVREAQWTLARNALRRAVPAAPRDNRLVAALRYCEGQLHRINGEAAKQRNEEAEAQSELSESVALFREAAELRSDWPDPFLGLARVFISGLDDVDRGANALEQAQQRGYTLTERETSLLADGYRARGTSFARIARKLEGMPQESDYLTKAVEAYQRALELYVQSSNTQPKITENIRGTQRQHDDTQHRLDELSPPLPDAPEPEPIESPAPTSSGNESIGAVLEVVHPWA